MRPFLLLSLGLMAAQCQPTTLTKTSGVVAPSVPADADSTARPLDPNGINKVYLGRQIAQVMGHEGADWLERPDRQREERTDLLLKALQELPLRADAVLADIGAGTGYFTFRLAPLVPRGRVLAVDIEPAMLAEIERRKQTLHVFNVRAVRGSEKSPHLPADSVDLVLLVDAYHEFEFPAEMMAGIRQSLKPGGVVALVEYRAEDPAVPIKAIHKMSVAQARREWEAAGFRFRAVREGLPQQHLLLFEK